MTLTRRRFVQALPLALGAGTVCAFTPQPPTVENVHAALMHLEKRNGGRLGVYAINTGNGRTMAHRAGDRFLMCSTFKALLAAQVLSRIDAGQETAGQMVPYSRSDMIFTSPVTEANIKQGGMTVEALCQAMLETSDNTAAVLLMKRCGGPEGLTRFVRGLGDGATRCDRYEPQSNAYQGMQDTTTPLAMATTMGKLLLGTTLSAASLDKLEAGMRACKPGLNRLRAALPTEWVAADRPGTSLEEETNDVAIVRPPGRAPLLVAVYYDNPRQDLDRRESVLREVGKTFVWWAQG